MKRLLSIVALFLVAGGCALAQSTATVSGLVTDQISGGPVPGAAVRLSGGGTDKSTKTDSSGHYSFDGVVPGVYTVGFQAKQYNSSVSAPFGIVAGQAATVSVALAPVATSTLTLIGTVRVNNNRAVNTGSAPTINISNSQLVAAGITQVQEALATEPGVTIERYDGSAPGNVTTLTIRGAGAFVGQAGGGSNNTGYEVLVLQDGEPLRNGQYGDFDLSSLTPAIYSNVEVIKGIGGSSLFGANTIGGTLNLVTRDPSKTEGGQVIGTVGSFSMTDFNLLETNTFGRFGYVLDFHRYGTNGYINPNFQGDFINNCGFSPPTPPNGPCLIAPASQTMNLTSFLAKLRYDFSPVTFLTLEADDEADYRDQSGLLANPNPVSNPSPPPNTFNNNSLGVPYFYGFPGNYVWNIQPKYGAMLHSQIGGGDLVLRYYSNLLERVVDGYNVAPPETPFLTRSVDWLTGIQGYWTKALNDQNTLTVAAGGNGDDFYFSQNNGTIQTFQQLQPQASGSQLEKTVLLRDEFRPNAKWDLNLAAYYSNYNTLNVKRVDPRFGAVFKPDSQTAVRFNVGTGFAPPVLSQLLTPLNLSQFTSVNVPQCPSNNFFCAATSGNPNLKPETGFGYDLGIDHAFGSAGILSFDVYQTYVTNHIYTATLPAPPGLVFAAPPTPPPPVLYIVQPINIQGTTFEGYELSARVPATHQLGVTMNYNTQVAFPTGLDANTQNTLQTVVNNQQYLGVPQHKYGYGVDYSNRGLTAYFGGQYQGTNNPYNQPPFWLYNASLTLPLGATNALHVNWLNIFNTNAYIFANFDGGVPYPGYSGPSLTTAFPVAPTQFAVTFEHRWGSLLNH
ncbi:MAG: TonB-dependent receptor [Candidatus Eremiobacteraeota bacterium]|nr:TonB-dependent receptor [Candidatus Eremiobacteraeota bacterium]